MHWFIMGIRRLKESVRESAFYWWEDIGTCRSHGLSQVLMDSKVTAPLSPDRFFSNNGYKICSQKNLFHRNLRRSSIFDSLSSLHPWTGSQWEFGDGISTKGKCKEKCLLSSGGHLKMKKREVSRNVMDPKVTARLSSDRLDSNNQG